MNNTIMKDSAKIEADLEFFGVGAFMGGQIAAGIELGGSKSFSDLVNARASKIRTSEQTVVQGNLREHTA